MIDEMEICKRFEIEFKRIYSKCHVHWDSRHPQPSIEAMAFMSHLHKTGPISISEASLHFDRSMSATTELIDRMKKQNWVSKQTDQTDKRSKFIWFTEYGESIYEKCQRVLDFDKLQNALNLLTEAEKENLLTYLKKIGNII
jgi:DNA-binding MarR family transcriptional regulator